MSKVSKKLGIAGCIVSLVITLITVPLVILNAIGFFDSLKSNLNDQVVQNVYLAIVIPVLIFSFAIPVALIITILVYLNKGEPKKVFIAGILEIVISGLSLLSVFTDPWLLLNLVGDSLMLASGIIICVDYSKLKKNKNKTVELK